jgi:L-threonylcarbamoyladenylate synthase
VIDLPDNPAGFAHGLFAALFTIDALGADVVVIERVPGADPAWLAVADRLARASRGQR